MISILLGENMIQLLLGGIAIYTLHENRKSIKRLRDIAANHQVNHQVNHQAHNQANNQANNQVIQPVRKIRINPSSVVTNSQTIMYKDDEWNLGEHTDLYVGREIIFTKKRNYNKYIGIIKKVNKKTIHISSVTQIQPYRRVLPTHYLFIVKIPCVYVCYDDDDFDNFGVCKGEIN
tara:strand:- start:1046 stop:1573 length:528 start_codon:yes stop_codon:yes gene_type:complete